MKATYFITIHPELVTHYLRFGVFKAAQQKNILSFHVIDLRQFAVDGHGTVDDKPYGGGEGMVLRVEPLAQAVERITAERGEKPYVIHLSPAAPLFTQARAAHLANMQSSRDVAFICGRFSGVDQRFIDLYVDEEVAIGRYVLSGGELPAMVVAEAALRLMPDVLGDKQSAALDSLSEAYGGRGEYPLYTRPPSFRGLEVPPVLLTGDHAAIADWRGRHLRHIDND